MLKEFKQKSKDLSSAAQTTVEKQTPYDTLRKEQLDSLQQRKKFAPTLEDIRERERANMRNGRSTSVQLPKDQNE